MNTRTSGKKHEVRVVGINEWNKGQVRARGETELQTWIQATKRNGGLFEMRDFMAAVKIYRELYTVEFGEKAESES